MLQVSFLAVFLAFVVGFRDFTLPWTTMALIVAATLATQRGLELATGAPSAGPLSPMISALSLCLLLRTNEWWVAAAAAFLSIASKFVLRIRGKHVFNPTNFGILAAIVLTREAWVGPSQWGSAALLAFLIAALGSAVVARAGRIDIALAFLAAHLGLKLLRVTFLGQRFAVFEHQALSGAIILFAFFMISDPRSTPDRRLGRVVFAVAVALVSHVLQFRLFWNDAPLWALLFVSPLTPLLDTIWPAARFQWRERGSPDEAKDTAPAVGALPAAAGRDALARPGLLRLLRREG